MHILLIAATIFEIETAIEFYTKNNLKDKKIDYLITDIGQVQTTYHITQYVQNTKPDIIIQAGIAGCFKNNPHLTNVVCVYKDFFADLGVMENNVFKDVFDLNLCDHNIHPFQNKALINPHKNICELFNLPYVNGITINEITTNKDRILLYKEKYNADIETMEGAAFHYVCLQYGIPFIQIRSISNKVGVRDKSEWKIEEAIYNLNNKLIDSIELL